MLYKRNKGVLYGQKTTVPPLMRINLGIVSWLKGKTERGAMKRTYHIHILLTLGLALVFAAAATAQTNDSLPSWNEGEAKQAITRFVKDVSTAGGSRFVPLAERIAVFDNDGTLWAEQPMYFQLAFVHDKSHNV